MGTPSSSDPHAAEWELLVGKAILRFGDIELVSVKYLQLFGTSKSDQRRDFSERADLIIKHLESNSERNAELDELLRGYTQAKELAKNRNLIAHNPVMLSLYVNEDQTESFAHHAITSARKESWTLDLEGLKEYTAEVEDLSSRLWLSFLKVAGTSEHLWNTHPLNK
jgi:hypothetical protein